MAVPSPLLIVTGPPGAGKSTVADVLAARFERCVARVATRTGHGFSDDAATRKMHNGFATAEVDTRHVLVDPPEGPGSVADRILAARVAGALSYATPC